jgi:putative PLP-dependent aminotransferase (TIGR04422 family)
LKNKSSYTEIEEFFENEFGKPCVLFSSARVAITNILKSLEKGRSDYVYIPPYLSHCVLNAISYIATPTSNCSHDNLTLLLSHQWGYKEKQGDQEFSNIIEDSADSFPLNGSDILQYGNFEVFSLCKIIGTMAGGIVFTSTQKEKNDLINLRNSSRSMITLKYLGQYFSNFKAYWSTMEIHGGQLDGLSLSDISKKLNNWRNIKNERIAIAEKMNLDYSGRIPTCVYFSIEDDIIVNLKNAGIKFNYLSKTNFDKGKYSFKKVIVVPIHHEVSREQIELIIMLNGEKNDRI